MQSSFTQDWSSMVRIDKQQELGGMDLQQLRNESYDALRMLQRQLSVCTYHEPGGLWIKISCEARS